MNSQGQYHSPEEHILVHKNLYQDELEKERQRHYGVIDETFTDRDYDRRLSPIDLKQLGDYKPISFSDLTINKRHIGFKLTATLFDKPFGMAGIHLLLKFPDTKEIARLTLYNAPLESRYLKDLEREYKEGTKVVILNPYYKVYVDSWRGLRIDDPKEFDEYRAEGNVNFQKKRYQEAIRLYTLAIDADPRDVRPYGNRSQCYIELGKFEDGIIDANKAIELDPSIPKNYLRKITCLKNLKRYDEAFQCAKAGLKVTKELEDIFDSLPAMFKEAMEGSRVVSVKKEKKKVEEKPKDIEVPKPKPEPTIEFPVKRWEKVIPNGIKVWGRSCHSCIQVQDNFLVWGGTRETPMGMSGLDIDVLQNDAMFFDCVNNKWWCPTFGENGPRARTGHTLTKVGNMCYLFGGGDAWSLNLSTVQWKRIKNIEFIVSNSTTVAMGNNIYLFGGHFYDGRVHYMQDSLWLFSTDTLSLKEIKKSPNKPWPSPRSHAASGQLSDRYFIVFGGDGNRSQSRNDLWMFDTKEEAWIEISTKKKPEARGTDKVLLPVLRDNKLTHLILHGGVGISGTAYKDIWALNVATLEWEEITTGSTSLPKTTQTPPVIVNGSLFTFGGLILPTVSQKSIPTSLEVTDYIFKFPIEQVLSVVPESPISWCCINCNQYTKRKCSYCKKHAICSEVCEENSVQRHEFDCSQAGGREDPNKRKMRLLEAQVKNLKKQLSEEDAKRNEINDQFAAAQTEKSRVQELLKAQQRKVEDMTQLNKDLEVEIQNKRKLIAEKEREVIDKHSKNEKLNEELKELQKQQEEQIKLQTKRQEHIALLEVKVSDIQSNYEKKLADELKQQELLQKQLSGIDDKCSELQQQLEASKKKLIEVETKAKDEQEKDICGICLDKPKSIVVIPCGHCYCNDCSKIKRCAICRQDIQQRSKIFFG